MKQVVENRNEHTHAFTQQVLSTCLKIESDALTMLSLDCASQYTRRKANAILKMPIAFGKVVGTHTLEPN